jgi:hypothetical protein
VLGHAIEQEPMQSIVRVRVITAHRFEDDERLPEVEAGFDSSLKAEVVLETSCGRHPIQHVADVRARRAFIQQTDARVRDARSTTDV